MRLSGETLFFKLRTDKFQKECIMKKKLSLTFVALLCIILLFSFAVRQFMPSIPKVWDVEQLKSMHLPYPDTTIKLGFISEDYYNQLPVRISYKSYPFYMPGIMIR